MKVPNDMQQYSDTLNALGIRHEMLEHPELKTPLEDLVLLAGSRVVDVADCHY